MDGLLGLDSEYPLLVSVVLPLREPRESYHTPIERPSTHLRSGLAARSGVSLRLFVGGASV